MPPYPRWRVILYREGVFVRGGRFCTLPQATPGKTPTVPPSRDISTLQRQIHPPERVETPTTGSPKHRRRVILYPEDTSVYRTRFQQPLNRPGGCFCPRRAILHALTSRSRQNTNTFTLPRQFHPPKTNTPSRAISWTVSSRSCAALKRREHGRLKNGNKTTNI